MPGRIPSRGFARPSRDRRRFMRRPLQEKGRESRSFRGAQLRPRLTLDGSISLGACMSWGRTTRNFPGFLPDRGWDTPVRTLRRTCRPCSAGTSITCCGCMASLRGCLQHGSAGASVRAHGHIVSGVPLHRRPLSASGTDGRASERGFSRADVLPRLPLRTSNCPPRACDGGCTSGNGKLQVTTSRERRILGHQLGFLPALSVTRRN